MRKIILGSASLILLLASACSTRYMIIPDRETTYYLEGHEAQIAEGEGCRVAAYSVKNDLNDLIVEVRVGNPDSGDLVISPSQFSLSGPALKGESVKAVEPAAYASKLLADADNLEKRTKLSTWEGVEAITTSTVNQGDKDIKKVRKDYEESEQKKKDDLKTAAELRRKEKALRGHLTTSMTAKKKSEAKGTILFPGPFEKTGKVTVTLNHPKCTAFLPFTLKK